MLGLSRASYYRGEPLAQDHADNLRLMHLIDEDYTRHPCYGSRKMASWLRMQGYRVTRQRVRRLMRRLGLQSVAPTPCTSRPAPAHPVYPYLLRGLAIERPHPVWCTDITYLRLAHGFVYLTAVMDGYSRYVLSWEVSVTLAEAFCISALESAWRGHGRPELFNSDQGAPFTRQAFTAVLTAAGVRISRDGQGRAMDNIRVERRWRTVKYEEIYLKGGPAGHRLDRRPQSLLLVL